MTPAVTPTNDNRPTARFLPIHGVVGRNGEVRFRAPEPQPGQIEPRFPNDPREV